jgi:DNA-binding CsgD family transcriptional regulator
MTPNQAEAPVVLGAFSIKDFARTFSISERSVYNEIDRGNLKTYHVGRRRFVSASAALEWQKGRESPAPSAQ